MPKKFKIFVPGEYTFMNYFLPGIKNPALECFEVDKRRHGVQRKGNNHLVVFLDFCLKKESSKFIEANGNETEDFLMETPADIDFFKRMFGCQKEVAVFSLSYNARMSVIAWKLLIDIANDEKLLVVDDSGKLMRGPECVKEHELLLGQG